MTTFEVIVLLLAFGEFILNLVSTITKLVEKRDKKISHLSALTKEMAYLKNFLCHRLLTGSKNRVIAQFFYNINVL